MLDKVEVRNNAGTLLTLTLNDVTDGFVVEDIEGLGPVKATIVYSSFAGLDGVQYQSSKREARNLVFTIGLEPDYVSTSVRDLRQQLYNFFMTKSEVFLRFFEDELTVDISGRVESCEPALFSKDPAVVISIICPEPDFVELTPIVVAQNTVNDPTEFLVEYAGTVECGFVVTISVDRVETDFTIYHRGPDNVVRSMYVAGDFVSGDVVKVSTVPGDKYVTLTRSGVTSSLLYGLSAQSPWHELKPGTNYMRVYTTGIQIPYTLTYTERHGGL